MKKRTWTLLFVALTLVLTACAAGGPADGVEQRQPFFIRGEGGQLAQLNGSLYWLDNVHGRLYCLEEDGKTVVLAAENELFKIRSWSCLTGYGQRLYVSDMTSDIGIAAIDPATGDVETLIQPKSLFPYFTIDSDGTLYLARNLDNSRESENQGAQLLAYDLNDLQAEPRTVYERLGEGCMLDYPNLVGGGLVLSEWTEGGVNVLRIQLPGGEASTLVEGSAHYGGSPAVGASSCLAVQREEDKSYSLRLLDEAGKLVREWTGFDYAPMVSYVAGLYLIDEDYRPTGGEMPETRELWAVDEAGQELQGRLSLPGEASRCLGTDGERLYFLAQESDPSQGLYAASVEDFGQAGGLQRLGG